MQEAILNSTDLLWWEAYGFIEHPFDSPAQHDFLFLPKPWSANLERLKFLWENTAQSILIQGPAGVGKSTLVEQFIDRLDEAVPLCHLLGSSDLSTEELIEAMCGCFDLSNIVEEGTSVRVLLNTLLAEMIKRNQRGLLIIEQLEKIKTPVIQALSYLQAEGREYQSPLTIMLVMNSTFFQPFEQIVSQYTSPNEMEILLVEPFSYQETLQYLAQRFNAAGLTGELPFEETELRKIQQQALGIPALVNQHTETLLLSKLKTYPVIESELKVKPRLEKLVPHKNKLLGAISLITLAILFFYWWQNNINTNLYDEPTRLVKQVGEQNQAAGSLPAIVSSHQTTASAPAVVSPNQVTESAPAVVSSNQVTASAPAVVSPNQVTESAPAVVSPNQVTESAPAVVSPNQVTESAPAVVSPNQVTASAPAVVSPNQVAASRPAVISPPVVLDKKPVTIAATPSYWQQNSLASQELVQSVGIQLASSMKNAYEMPMAKNVVSSPSTGSSTIVTAPALSKMKTVEKKARPQKMLSKFKSLPVPNLATRARGPVPSLVSRSRDQLTSSLMMTAQEHERGYTIQLMGSRKLSDLDRYRHRAQLKQEPVSYFKTKFNGRDWYVLIYGHYHTALEAKNAISSIPSSLREKTTTPWVRSAKSVQTAIAMR